MVLPADSLASGTFSITGYRGSTVVSQIDQDFTLWQEFNAGDLEFDFGWMSRSLSAEMNVYGEYSYVISLGCLCTALAGGWPGSLAGATLNTSIPSVTVDVQMELPLENA
jgi:hypothetical protein